MSILSRHSSANNLASEFLVDSGRWERSGSVVECLTRDRRAVVRASPESLRCGP